MLQVVQGLDTGKVNEVGFIQSGLYAAFGIWQVGSGQFTAMNRGAGDSIKQGAFAAVGHACQGDTQARFSGKGFDGGCDGDGSGFVQH